MTYIAGIDGGGTKTTAVITTADGKFAAKASAGPVNPNVVKQDELYETFSGLMHDLSQQDRMAFNQLTSLFAGISGAGNNKAVQMLTGLLKELIPEKTRVRVEPDTVNALYSGTLGEPGIVQIAGTGSITFGINAEGRRDRTGGWGYLFGDEGSGYDIGKAGITAALKAFDGRGRDTVLFDMVCSHFQIADPYNLIQYIYSLPSPKSAISPVAKLVFEAYKQQDTVAAKIMRDAATEVMTSIQTLKAKLYQPDEKVNAVLCGGIFEDKDVLLKLLKKEFQSDQTLTLITPDMTPVGGSIIGACLMENNSPDETIVQNLSRM
ncbi:BadF-type ATPase [Lentibacillus persicus]|uniref:BadF-type ATPase n=1 Tax=Lentibacillus persicus TaxID=640948 RepID=A0A1I2AYN5_9BACI|nr:BadF/BadG/BcrA/BcrD ATPase family protein [Lentibacillus persicus]SFE48879.1 BadF-type ATPase [Lentibacillus persicus]